LSFFSQLPEEALSETFNAYSIAAEGWSDVGIEPVYHYTGIREVDPQFPWPVKLT